MPRKSAQPEQQDYSTLSSELDTVLAKLQAPDIPVHQALVLYERGLVLIGLLEQHLQSAENTVARLALARPESLDDEAASAESPRLHGRAGKAGQ